MSNSQTDKIGRVVSTSEGPAFDTVEVRLDSGKIVRPGQFLYAILEGDAEAPSKITVLRVSSAREWNAYEDPESSQVRDQFNIQSSRERGDLLRKFTVATTVPIEVVSSSPSGGYIHEEPAYIIPAGSVVYDNLIRNIANEVLGFAPLGTSGMIELGTTVGTQNIPVTLSANYVLPRHMLMVGSTGTGKSWALGKISEELHKIGIRHINVDIHGEMNEATTQLKGRNVVPGKDLTVKLSSLDEPEILGMIPVTNELHVDIVTKAVINMKSQRLSFGIADLKAEACAVATSYGVKQNTLGIVEARVGQLSKVSILGAGFDWKTALAADGAIINIDCRGLQRSQLTLIVGAVTRELYKLRSTGEIKPLVLSIDEAHLFLPMSGSSPSSIVLSELIRMGRHIAMGAILVTQSPGDLDRHVAKITNTRLIFAIEPSELSSIEGLLEDTPDDLYKSIPRMRTGSCLLVGSRETVKHSTIVKIGGRSTTHGGMTPKMIED